jgi:hypothetical protein
MFKKHVLVKGEKGTKQYYGSIAAWVAIKKSLELLETLEG